MLAFLTLFALLAVLSVSAMPTHHGRGLHHGRKIAPRSSVCRPAASSASPSAVSSPAPTSSAVSSPAPSSAPSSAASVPSSSSSSSTPSPSPSLGTRPSSGLIGILADLFPVPQVDTLWTTAPEAQDPLPLSDATLRPTKVLSALTHTYMAAPDGKYAMQAHYPEGSYTFTHSPQGGFSFYAPGPTDIDLTTAKEATFGYQVFFEDGFAFNLGGKLPGLYGGNSAEEAVSCSGGRRDDGCFSARLMWRTDGMGELYTYLPPDGAGNTGVCDIPPFSTCNDVYGASVGRGSYNFTAGAWTTVSQRVRLNDVGVANGELELFANGQSVVNVGGLTLRNSSDGRIYGIQAQTFFGGDEIEYASPKDQDSYFSDFSIAITEPL